MRNQRGITLIALVITIIVLLILAGVSIAMLTGENGILTRASTAADETALANGKELAQTDLQAVITAWYDAKYVSSTPTTDDLFTYAKANLKPSDTSVYTYEPSTGVITLKEVTGVTGTLTASGPSGDTNSAVSINWTTSPAD